MRELKTVFGAPLPRFQDGLDLSLKILDSIAARAFREHLVLEYEVELAPDGIR